MLFTLEHGRIAHKPIPLLTQTEKEDKELGEKPNPMSARASPWA